MGKFSDDDLGGHTNKNYSGGAAMTCAQVITGSLTLLMFGMLIILIGLNSATFDKVQDYTPQTVVTVAYSSLGLPGYEKYSWVDVTGAAVAQKVNFYAYNASAYSKWINQWLAPNLLDNFDITLVYHPIWDTGDVVNTIQKEIETYGNGNNGSVDLMWINGENFATMKNNGWAYGPWANVVPNAANFDFSSDTIKYDFGLATDGYEMPYNAAQVVFCYNSAKVAQTSISNIKDLIDWIKANPGRFTYAAPRYKDASGEFDHDYTGSAFIRHIFYYVASPYTQFVGSFNSALYKKYAPTFYKTLRDLQPYLLDASTKLASDKTTGSYYPNNQELIDNLFASGEVDVTLSYDVGHATVMIENNKWASTSSATVLTSGTIANTNFVLIPSNAKHKLAAVVVGNYIASAQAMFSRAQPEVIGALQSYDPSSTKFAEGGWNDAFEYIDRAPSTPSLADLSKYRVGELSASYINQIEQDWYICVVQYTSGSSPAYCG